MNIGSYQLITVSVLNFFLIQHYLFVWNDYTNIKKNLGNSKINGYKNVYKYKSVEHIFLLLFSSTLKDH